jgi:hypothetical protein
LQRSVGNETAVPMRASSISVGPCIIASVVRDYASLIAVAIT